MDSRDGDSVENGQFFGSNIHALDRWAAKTADRCTPGVNIGGVFGTGTHWTEAGLLRNIHGVVQRCHGGRAGIVGDKNSGEVLIASPCPFEWTFDRITPANALDGETRDEAGEDQGGALGGSVVVVVDASGGVGGGCGLVTESGGPGWRGENFSAFIGDRGFDVHDIGVVETETLADDEILIG